MAGYRGYRKLSGHATHRYRPIHQPLEKTARTLILLVDVLPAVRFNSIEVSNILFTTEPRIALSGGGGGGGRRGGRSSNETGISITAYMMAPGEDKIVADRIFQVLSAPRPPWKPESPKAPAVDLTGRWDVHIEFVAGSAVHAFHVKQQGNQLVGTHQGDFVARDFSGRISGDEVQISSSVGEEHGAALSYRFTGKLSGDKMSGDLDMGEYLGARWSATRHAFGRGQGGDLG